ncbi:MAG: hypothetical protein ACYDC2_10695 [Solirubrobacteraceae bacterium]
MPTDKEYLLTDAFKRLERAEALHVGERESTKLRRVQCTQAGHPTADAVSGPLPSVTEYLCRVCGVYFTREGS